MKLSLLRMRDNKTLINGSLFSLFSFLNRGISFLLLILLANYIQPAEYGELSIFNTVVMFLGYFVGLSTAGYLSVSFFQKKDELKEDFSAICLITIAMFVLLSFVIILFNETLSAWLKIEGEFLYIALVIAFSSVFVQLNLDYFRIQEKISLYGLLSCSFAILNFAFSLYLVINEGLNWKGRVYAQIICDLIFLLIAVGYFFKDKLFCFPKEIDRYREILWWGIPLIPHLASNWIRQGCDRYIIDASHTMADVGLFSFALNLTSIIIMIGTAFNATNSVGLYKILSADVSGQCKRFELRRKEHLITSVYVIATLLIIFLAVSLLPWLLPHYADSLPYFIILSFYGFMQCMYFLYCNYLFYFRKTKELMYITFGTSIIHLFLSLCLTRYSLFFTSFVYVISFTLMALLAKRKARVVYSIC